MRKTGRRCVAQEARRKQGIALFVQIGVIGRSETEEGRFHPGHQFRVRFDNRFRQFEALDRGGKQFARQCIPQLLEICASTRRESMGLQAFRQGCFDQVGTQRFGAAESGPFQGSVVGERQLTPRLLELVGQGTPQQPFQPAPMRLVRFVRIFEDAQGNAVAQIDQGRIGNQAFRRADRLRNILDVEPGKVLSGKFRVGALRKGLTRCCRPFRLDVGEVAAGGDFLSVDVAYAKAHAQMRGKFDAGKISRRDRYAGDFLQVAGERFDQALPAGMPLGSFRLGEGAREVRRRHEVPAQRFRQSADQFGHLFHQQARNKPVAGTDRQGIEQGKRHMRGNAIGRVAGHEAVFEPQLLRAGAQAGGKIVRAQARCRRQHVGQRPAQRRLLFRARPAVPGIERCRSVDIAGQLAGEEVGQVLRRANQA